MPPRRLQLGEVPGYVKKRHGIDITRQTAYNWMKIGRKGLKLRADVKKSPLQNHYVTTTTWVDAFVASLGVSGTDLGPDAQQSQPG